MTATASENAAESGRRSRGRPRGESVASIESEILAVALDQFVRHGYGVSMSRIVQAAGISKTTMYSRFPSKEALFRAIIRQQIDKVAATMPLGSPKSTYDLERGLRNYANRTLEVSLESGFVEVNRLIFSESGRFPELGAAAAERSQMGLAELSSFIRQRAEADGVPCRDPDSVAAAIIFMMRGWYIDAMLRNAEVPAREREEWVERSIRTLIASRAEW